jgi:hypothetical protein
MGAAATPLTDLLVSVGIVGASGGVLGGIGGLAGWTFLWPSHDPESGGSAPSPETFITLGGAVGAAAILVLWLAERVGVVG